MICSPSTTRRARFNPPLDRGDSNPPAASIASETRAPEGTVTKPGSCTSPRIWTTTVCATTDVVPEGGAPAEFAMADELTSLLATAIDDPVAIEMTAGVVIVDMCVSTHMTSAVKEIPTTTGRSEAGPHRSHWRTSTESGDSSTSSSAASTCPSRRAINRARAWSALIRRRGRGSTTRR